MCLKTIMGRNTPQMTKSTRRRLQFRQPKSRKKYIKDSIKIVAKHKMCRKIRMLQKMTPSRNRARYKTTLNKFNDDHITIQTACEKKCRKIRNNTIAWFQMVTIYGNELRVYKWIRSFKREKRTNVNNLQRACRNNNI